MKIRLATPDDAEGIARVQVDTWRSAYQGILPESVLDNLSLERSTQMWRNSLENRESQSFVYVVLDEAEEVFGFAAAGQTRDTLTDFPGEVYALYVLPGQQRSGAGRALVRAAAEQFHERGMNEMVIWVLRDNMKGRGFYEAIGGTAIASRDIEISGAPIAEVSYGWRDLGTWLAPTAGT